MTRDKKRVLIIGAIVALLITAGILYTRYDQKKSEKKEAVKKQLLAYKDSPEGRGVVISNTNGPLSSADQLTQDKASLKLFEDRLATSGGKTINNYYYVIVSAHAVKDDTKAQKYLLELKSLSVTDAQKALKDSTVLKLESLLKVANK